MIALFIIFLREGVEASMIVAILLAYLDQAGQRRHFRDVYVGVGIALGAAAAAGVVGYLSLQRYAGSRVQTYVETATFVVAIVALTVMTFWMQRHARSMRAELARRSDAALSSRQRFALSALAFQAVGREGLETTVFTLAILFSNVRQGATPATGGALWGALAGLACSLLIAVALYRWGRRLNLARFFRGLGALLLLVGAGLVADTVENLQQLGWWPFGTHVLWNSSNWVSESSNLGDVLHSILGYADQPTLSQLVLWALYLVGALVAFRLVSRPRPTR